MNKTSKILILALLALIVLGGAYYLWGQKNQDIDQQRSVVNNSESIQDPSERVSASLNGKCTKDIPEEGMFSCALTDGSTISGVPSDIAGFWSHNFQVTHFDVSGKVLQVFSKNDGNAAGGEFNVSDVTNSVFSVQHRVIDPCYDATFTFTFNLKSGDYTEEVEGGEDMECWERNAHDGLF